MFDIESGPTRTSYDSLPRQHQLATGEHLLIIVPRRISYDWDPAERVFRRSRGGKFRKALTADVVIVDGPPITHRLKFGERPSEDTKLPSPFGPGDVLRCMEFTVPLLVYRAQRGKVLVVRLAKEPGGQTAPTEIVDVTHDDVMLVRSYQESEGALSLDREGFFEPGDVSETKAPAWMGVDDGRFDPSEYEARWTDGGGFQGAGRPGGGFRGAGREQRPAPGFDPWVDGGVKQQSAGFDPWATGSGKQPPF